MSQRDEIERYQQSLQRKEEEILFLKEELLKAAHQIERFAERAEAQARLSAKLLQLLVPVEIPRIGGYEISSKYVAATRGSEYLELMQYKEKSHFGVLLSHCQGTGLSALFIACLLKFSPQLESAKRVSPAAFIDQLTQELKSSLSDEARLHFLYGIMNRAASILSLSCLGDFLLLKRQATGEIQRLEINHSAFELSKPSSAPQIDIPFSVGESLCFLSPGFLQAFAFTKLSEAGDFFCQKLKKLDWQDLHQVRNEFFVLQKQSLSGKSSDFDASVLVLRNQDRGLKLAST